MFHEDRDYLNFADEQDGMLKRLGRLRDIENEASWGEDDLDDEDDPDGDDLADWLGWDEDDEEEL